MLVVISHLPPRADDSDHSDLRSNLTDGLPAMLWGGADPDRDQVLEYHSSSVFPYLEYAP